MTLATLKPYENWLRRCATLRWEGRVQQVLGISSSRRAHSARSANRARFLALRGGAIPARLSDSEARRFCPCRWKGRRESALETASSPGARVLRCEWRGIAGTGDRCDWQATRCHGRIPGIKDGASGWIGAVAPRPCPHPRTAELRSAGHRWDSLPAGADSGWDLRRERCRQKHPDWHDDAGDQRRHDGAGVGGRAWTRSGGVSGNPRRRRPTALRGCGFDLGPVAAAAHPRRPGGHRSGRILLRVGKERAPGGGFGHTICHGSAGNRIGRGRTAYRQGIYAFGPEHAGAPGGTGGPFPQAASPPSTPS